MRYVIVVTVFCLVAGFVADSVFLRGKVWGAIQRSVVDISSVNRR